MIFIKTPILDKMAQGKDRLFHTVVGLAVVVSIAYFFLKKEGFTSPGTMVQLSSSHVPTREDMYFYQNIYPKQVRREVTDMTGGDPGDLRPSLLSAYGAY